MAVDGQYFESYIDNHCVRIKPQILRKTGGSKVVQLLIVYYVPRHIMRVSTRPATMLAGDRSRGAISPASIVASLVISRIVCIGTYSILCDFGVNTSFYAYTRI